jgi:hypothetical protein
MVSQKPKYGRAFWTTAGIIGGINVALFLYLAYLPDAPIGKGGRMMKPIPQWSEAAIVINFPGALATLPFWAGTGQQDSGEWFAVMQVISTVFWGGVAVAVEWFSFRKRKSPADPAGPTPSAPSVTN